jgi:CRISPR system Cascade subunit CasC
MDTSSTRLVQFHTLTNLGPSKVNSGKDGSPKSSLLGGYPRSYVSSQTAKRHIRWGAAMQEQIADPDRIVRTRLMPQSVAAALQARGESTKKIEAIRDKLCLFGKSAERGDASDSAEVAETDEMTDGAEEPAVAIAKTKQLLTYRTDEIIEIADRCSEWYDDIGPDKWSKADINDLQELPFKPSIMLALFGRMSTATALSTVPGALAVSPALGVARLNTQYEFFTGVDDFASNYQIPAAGLLGRRPHDTTVVYQYWSLDVHLLLSNLKYDQNRAARAITALAWAIAELRLSAARNAFGSDFAPFWIGVEALTRKVGFNYVGAFTQPLYPTESEPNLESQAIRRLDEYMAAMWKGYGVGDYGQRAYFAREDRGTESLQYRRFETIRELAGWLLAACGLEGEAAV